MKENITDDLEEEVRDLKGIVTSLTTSISNLNKRMSNLEQMINNGFKNLLIALNDQQRDIRYESNSDIEIDKGSGEEDHLTPQDLFLLEEPLKITARELIKLRITTADEISKITKKQRAVESSYLNQLANRNYCRKIRVGRKIFFYTGPLKDLEPFQTLAKEFRLLMLSIFRLVPLDQKDSRILVKQLFDQYSLLNSDNGTNFAEMMDLVDKASMKLGFIEQELTSIEENSLVIFLKDVWRKI